MATREETQAILNELARLTPPETPEEGTQLAARIAAFWLLVDELREQAKHPEAEDQPAGQV